MSEVSDIEILAELKFVYVLFILESEDSDIEILAELESE